MAKRVFFNLIMMGVMAGCAGADIGVSETAVGSVVPADTETPRPTMTPSCFQPNPPSFEPIPFTGPSYFVSEPAPIAQPAAAISKGNINRLAELGRWGYGSILEVSFVADNQIMVVQTPIAIYGYTAGSLNEVWRIESDVGISALASSAPKQMLAFGTKEGTIHLVNAIDGTEINKWNAHEGEIFSLAFSFDDNKLASSGEDLITRMWDLADLTEIIEYRDEEEVAEVFFTKNNDKLVMRVWDSDYGTEYKYLNLETGIIDDSYLPEGGVYDSDPQNDLFETGTAILLISSQETVSSLEPEEKFTYGGGALTANISDDGSLVAMGLDYPGVGLWRVCDGKLLGVFETEEEVGYYPGKVLDRLPRSGPDPSGIYSVDISSDNRLIAATNGYGEKFLWDIESGKLIRRFSGPGDKIMFSPDNGIVVSKTYDSLDLYDVAGGVRLATLPGNWNSKLIFSPDGTRLANGSRLWNIETGELQFTGNGEWILGFSNDGNKLFTISPLWWVHTRNTDNLELIQEAEIRYPEKDGTWRDNSVRVLWYEMGGWRLSLDNSLIHGSIYEVGEYSWSVKDGVNTFASQEAYYLPTVFSPDRNYYATYDDYYEEIRIYKVVEGAPEFLHSIPFESSYPTSIKFSTDNEVVIVSANQKIYVFNIETGNQVFIIEIPDTDRFNVRIPAISPDGKILVIAVDNILYFYNLDNGNLLSTIEVPNYSFGQIKFSPDSMLLATRVSDGTLRLWGIPGD